MSELYKIPLNPMQYGLLEVSLRMLGTEQALETRGQIERQVQREGLIPITITINSTEYEEVVHALCKIALETGVGEEVGALVSHIKYFVEIGGENYGFNWNTDLQ